MPEFQIYFKKKTSEMEVALRFKLLTQLSLPTLLTQQWHMYCYMVKAQRIQHIMGLGNFILKLGWDVTDHYTP